MYNNNNIINRATARAIDFESKIISPSSNHSSRGPDPDPVPDPVPAPDPVPDPVPDVCVVRNIISVNKYIVTR